MEDQAASLRKLREEIDQRHALEKVDRELFLSELPRPSSFVAVALIMPDIPEVSISPVTNWISAIMQHSSRACFWDQSHHLPETFFSKPQTSLKYPVPVKIESDTASLTILPHQQDFIGLHQKPENARVDFMRHLMRSLKDTSELWISINAADIKKSFSIMQATDAVCIMVPQHQNSLLKCYEIVKEIHLSGYFSPIGLLDFSSERLPQIEYSSSKIKNVAKQFLAIDLVTSGVVLSNCEYIPPEDETNLRSRIDAVEEISRDFLYCLSEGLLYLIPGTF